MVRLCVKFVCLVQLLNGIDTFCKGCEFVNAAFMFTTWVCMMHNCHKFFRSSLGYLAYTSFYVVPVFPYH